MEMDEKSIVKEWGFIRTDKSGHTLDKMLAVTLALDTLCI